MIHHMERKSKEKKGEATLKIDISQSYDKVDWNFLKFMMQRMGFT